MHVKSKRAKVIERLAGFSSWNGFRISPGTVSFPANQSLLSVSDVQAPPIESESAPASETP